MSAVAVQKTNSLSENKVSTKRAIANNAATVFMIVSALLAIIPLAWLLWSTIRRGLLKLLHLSWWTKSDFITDGSAHGVLHGILGTLELGLMTSIVSIPIAVLAAIYLVEYGRGTRAAKVVSFTVDVLAGVPSIVAALFIYALFVVTFRTHISAILAALALVLLMIPVVLRSTEEMLKLVPNSLREASYALGVPRWKTITRVVLPTCSSGIITGIMLGLARVLGETAPLLVLVLWNQAVEVDPTQANFPTLPTLISNAYALAQLEDPQVWGAALTLIILVLGLNLIAKAISNKQNKRMGRR